MYQYSCQIEKIGSPRRFSILKLGSVVAWYLSHFLLQVLQVLIIAVIVMVIVTAMYNLWAYLLREHDNVMNKILSGCTKLYRILTDLRFIRPERVQTDDIVYPSERASIILDYY